jgi:hypothetical protein
LTILANPVKPAPPIGPLYLPVTGGQQVSLNCVSPYDATLKLDKFQVIFGDLCGYSVVLDTIPESRLVKPLAAGQKFAADLSVTLLKEGIKVNPVPDGKKIKVLYAIPADMTTKSFVVLFWDPTLKSGTGDWVEIPVYATAADGTVVTTPLHADHPADGLILSGVRVNDAGQIEFSVTFTGTFVLVTK